MRPTLHFTAQVGWLNDPNGLVYVDGVYHLFYQYVPDDLKWTMNMHWGHATSKDLLHWTEHDKALYPDEMGAMFSGSAIIDKENRAGFQKGDKPVVIAAYTAASDRSTQCLALSHDDGMTWEKYCGNPVLPCVEGANRDPKIFWHEVSQKWIMPLFLYRGEIPEGQSEEEALVKAFAIFVSDDLKSWKETDRFNFPGSGECPDLFPLQDENGGEYWIFWSADGKYLVGQFDGEKFHAQSDFQEAYARLWQNGMDELAPYAAQTYDNAPDNRRIQIPWLRGNFSDAVYNQQMGIPVDLALCTSVDAKKILTQRPALELRQQLKDCLRENLELQNGGVFWNVEDAGLLSMTVSHGGDFEIIADDITLKIQNGKIILDEQEELFTPEDDYSCEIVIDYASLEVFLDEGRKAIVLFKEQNEDMKILLRGDAHIYDIQSSMRC